MNVASILWEKKYQTLHYHCEQHLSSQQLYCVGAYLFIYMCKQLHILIASS